MGKYSDPTLKRTIGMTEVDEWSRLVVDIGNIRVTDNHKGRYVPHCSIFRFMYFLLFVIGVFIEAQKTLVLLG
jgi:hypothetical protein